MLKALTLTDFKNFAGEPQTVPFAPVTILVGANGSGKSNVFDALRFLQGLADDLSVGEVFAGRYEGGREVRPGLRGGVEEVCWNGREDFDLGACLSVLDQPMFHELVEITTGEVFPGIPEERLEKSPIDLDYKVTVDVAQQPRIDHEALLRDAGAAPVEIIQAWYDGRSSETGRFSFSGRREFGIDRRYFDRSLLRLGRGLAGFDQWPIVAACRYTLRNLQFMDLRPSEMRDYVDLPLRQLVSTGRNLSNVVQQIADTEDREQFLDWLSTLCDPRVLDLQFERTRHGIMLQLIEDADAPRIISARSLSDGTLRFMAFLAAIYAAPEGSILLFEEIENGLHPTRIHLLVELLERFAEARNLQIIATTHSSQVLLSLSDQALRNSVLFARVEDHPGTLVRRLGDLPHFDEVTQRTQIDELFTTGWMEFAV
jgi:predicted ATPase